MASIDWPVCIFLFSSLLSQRYVYSPFYGTLPVMAHFSFVSLLLLHYFQHQNTAMPVTISIRDENAAGRIIHEIPVSFSSELVSVKDIIQARVIAEVEQYNNKLPDYFNGLVQPTGAEQALNGFKLRDRKKIDAEKQCFVALEAFNKNAYFLLIDNIQAASLEQMVVINKNTELSFVKLTPLVGG